MTLLKKKVYNAPKFLKYGSLTEMTAANFMANGSMDNMTTSAKTG